MKCTLAPLGGDLIDESLQVSQRAGQPVNRGHHQLVVLAQIADTVLEARVVRPGAGGDCVLKLAVDGADHFALPGQVLLGGRDTDIEDLQLSRDDRIPPISTGRVPDASTSTKGSSSKIAT